MNRQDRATYETVLIRIREKRTKVKSGTFTGDKDKAIIALCDFIEETIEAALKQ